MPDAGGTYWLAAPDRVREGHGGGALRRARRGEAGREWGMIWEAFPMP